MSKEATNIIEVTAHELHGPGLLACPNPKMKLWSNHPKVYLDVVTTGEAKCPYCGTVYRVTSNQKVHSH